MVRARQLRAQGKSDAIERRTTVQIIRATGLKPPPPTVKPAGSALKEFLATNFPKPADEDAS